MSLFNRIETWDQYLFLYLNQFHSPFFDVLFYWISWPPVWFPVYLALIFFLWKKYGWKGLGMIVLCAAVLITMADQTANLFKNTLVMRYRPCHNADIGHLVHTVYDHCGGKYGFFSGHASNSFALATFAAVLFKNRKLLLWLWLWALVVGYSRIYLGVHYPLDVACGALFGIFYGWLVSKLYFYGMQKRYTLL